MKKPLTILHVFQWKLNDIINQLEEIKEAGYDAIQISPIQPHKKGPEWWTVYQPMDIAIDPDLKNDLKRLCYAANFLGIKVIADVVFNHTASDNQLCLVPHKDVNRRLRDNHYFWKESKFIYNWENRYEVINYCGGLPYLDLKNYELQDIVISFLNELIDIGIMGFRIDSAKNISLPEEDGNHFFTRVLGNLHKKDELFIMAELIFLKNQKLLENYAKYVTVLTNDDYWDQTKLCKFSESHDTYYEFKYTAWWDDERQIQEYRNLANNYKLSNLLFFARPIDDKYKDLWKDPEIVKINKSRKDLYY